MTAPQQKAKSLETAPLPRIFPENDFRRACFIDMNEIATRMKTRAGASRFLEADLTDRYLRLLHRANGCDVSYGGYLEDRKDLWRGSYLQDHNAVHLGIDINLPARTAVSVMHPCTVLRIEHDADRAGGWGSVVMFRLVRPIGDISHFLYAHLSKDSITVHEGKAVNCGDIIGRLGRVDENGGWYEHLHVQALTTPAWERTGGILANFDGYDGAQETAEHPSFPNPAALIF